MSPVITPIGRRDRLVEQAVSGDRGAFTALLKRHDAELRGFVSRLLARDAHLMDDVLQDAYVKAYRSLPGFRGESSFSTWLHRIAHNACIDELRRQARHAPPLDLRTVEDSLASPRSGPEHVTTTVDSVRRALDTLSADQRAVVVLVDGQGFDPVGAAEILGVPVGTVASRLSRARAALRIVLREEQ